MTKTCGIFVAPLKNRHVMLIGSAARNPIMSIVRHSFAVKYYTVSTAELPLVTAG